MSINYTHPDPSRRIATAAAVAATQQPAEQPAAVRLTAGQSISLSTLAAQHAANERARAARSGN